MLDFIKKSKLNNNRIIVVGNKTVDNDEYPLWEMIKDELCDMAREECREEGLDNDLEIIFENFIGKGYDKGLKKGFCAGLGVGERDTFIKIVRNMLNKGKDYDDIADLLDLPVLDVKRYAYASLSTEEK